MILFCLLPTFSDQDSKIRTHATARKIIREEYVKQKKKYMKKETQRKTISNGTHVKLEVFIKNQIPTICKYEYLLFSFKGKSYCICISSHTHAIQLFSIIESECPYTSGSPQIGASLLY